MKQAFKHFLWIHSILPRSGATIYAFNKMNYFFALG